MQAIVLRQHGDVDRLRLEEVPTPRPAPDEVLLRLEFAAVNRVDLDIRAGSAGMAIAFPHVPGTEGVGTIVARGDAVALPAIGDRVATQVILSCGSCPACRAGRENLCTTFSVLGAQRWGCYAQYVCVPAHRVVALPSAVHARDAIASNKLVTAWEALVDTVTLRRGETLLVLGASGGVGVAAVMLGKYLGARVIALASTADKRAHLEKLGADITFDSRTPDWPQQLRATCGDRAIHCVFDAVGGSPHTQALALIAPGGRVAVVGAHAGEKVTVDLVDLFRRHIAIHGCGRPTASAAREVYAQLQSGALRAPPFREFDLARAGEAQALMQARAHVGRIVLRIP